MTNSDYDPWAGAGEILSLVCNRKIAATAKTRGPSNSRTIRWSVPRAEVERCEKEQVDLFVVCAAEVLISSGDWTQPSTLTPRKTTQTRRPGRLDRRAPAFVEVVRKLGRDGASRRSLRAPYDHHVSDVSRVMHVGGECSVNG